MSNFSPNKKKTSYKLSSIIRHYGTQNGGHYTSCSQVGDKWYTFDDNNVSEIDSSNVVNSSAYVLFYEKRD